uniref:BSD domain-containing protein n=1 Tax=Noccaea caerulescens TaxID=107243 RepID=A0A1J3JBF3_NOCCA
MEDFWKRAKSFAEEAAKKSQTITLQSSSTTFANLVSETAKKSKEFALEASKKADQLNVSDFVAETAKKSKEFAAEVSTKADQLKVVALKQADQIQNIKSIADIIPPQLAAFGTGSGSGSGSVITEAELLSFGITDDLREFVKGLTSATFQAFPEQDESSEVSDLTTTASNVRKDLSEWQERHATLVLGSVKQISKLRYELCPRVMKERRFWRIYFTLVSTHVAPYERKYMEELRSEAESKDEEAKKALAVGGTEAAEKDVAKNRTSTASSEQDLDTFLLGDLEDSDEAPDDGDGSLDDDDFDKIGNSDVEEEKENENEKEKETEKETDAVK